MKFLYLTHSKISMDFGGKLAVASNLVFMKKSLCSILFLYMLYGLSVLSEKGVHYVTYLLKQSV